MPKSSNKKYIRSINFPMIDFWHKIQNKSEDEMYNFLFSRAVGSWLKDDSLAMNLINTLVISSSGFNNFDEAKESILSDLNISDSKKSEIFYDQVFGIGNLNGISKWTDMIKQESDLKQYFVLAKDLSEYFNVSLNDISTLTRFILKNVNTATTNLVNQAKCPSNKCSSIFLYTLQTSKSLISKNIAGKNTLKDDNDFLFSFEYAAFYEDNFKSIGKDYDDLYFTSDQIEIFYNIDPIKLKPNASWNVLTHYSNLQYLRNSCKTFWLNNLPEDKHVLSYYDQMKTVKDIEFNKKNFSAFDAVKTRFKFLNYQQCEVTCGYIEHIFNQTLLEKQGGNYEFFILTQMAAENMEKTLNNLHKLGDKLVHHSFVGYVYKNYPHITCSSILTNNSQIPGKKIGEICSKYISQWGEALKSFLWDLYDNCEHVKPENSFNLKPLNLSNFCSFRADVELSYINLFNKHYDEFKKIYGFGDGDFSLTKLAMLQMTKSCMTLNKNPYVDEDVFPQSSTANKWDEKTFERPFELAYFVRKYDLDSSFLESLNLQTITQFLNKSSLFHPLKLYYSIIFGKNKDFSYFTKFMGIQENMFDAFWKYIVLFVREYYLGGFFINVSESDIENGLSPSFLYDQKFRQILLGGDPSIQYPFPIRYKRSDYVFEKLTGEDSFEEIDNFFKVNGSKNITNDIQVFNGNVTSTYKINPWTEDIPVSGCENYCHESDSYLVPLQGDDDTHKGINVYRPAMNRTIEYDYTNTKKLDFMNCWVDQYTLNQKQYLPNYKEYHQGNLAGFFNMTSVLNSPVLISQNYLYSVEPKINENFEYFDKKNKRIFPTQEMSGGIYETEQQSRTVTKIDTNFHYSLEIKPNSLFVGVEKELDILWKDKATPLVVPMFNMRVSMEYTEKMWKDIFKRVSSYNFFFDSYFPITALLFLIILIILVLLVYLFLKEFRKNRVAAKYKDFEKEEISSQDIQEPFLE